MNEWIKIEDVRPSEDEMVIAFSKRDGINYNVCFCFDEFGRPLWQRSGQCNMEDVTHWMYLPVRPKIVCRICEDTETTSIRYELCDRCLELENRIHNNIKLARKIIANVDNVNKFT